MDYALAKELKDAGFQIPGNFKGDIISSDKDRLYPNAYIPTLSELIEACGEYFVCLEKRHDRWLVIGSLFQSLDQQAFWGKTPKEAVANLYLAIKKK